MYFTAREKVYLARGLFDEENSSPETAQEPEPLAVSTAEAAAAMAFEQSLLLLAEEYGIHLEPAADHS